MFAATASMIYDLLNISMNCSRRMPHVDELPNGAARAQAQGPKGSVRRPHTKTRASVWCDFSSVEITDVLIYKWCFFLCFWYRASAIWLCLNISESRTKRKKDDRELFYWCSVWPEARAGYKGLPNFFILVVLVYKGRSLMWHHLKAFIRHRWFCNQHKGPLCNFSSNALKWLCCLIHI